MFINPNANGKFVCVFKGQIHFIFKSTCSQELLLKEGQFHINYHLLKFSELLHFFFQRDFHICLLVVIIISQSGINVFVLHACKM